jgi:hypothetical protein
VLLAALALPVAAVAATPTAPTRDPLSGLIAGLLAYTHWTSPLETVRLCIWGHDRDVGALQPAALGSAQRQVTIQRNLDLALVAQRCDALYVASSAPAGARNLARALVGRPVLVIGEGLPSCAEGAMFCIDTAERPLRFQANLDAIARSGLRVDPQVLRIGRPIGAAP